MSKSKAQTHQTNRLQLSYSWLGTCIFLSGKWWIEPGFIALNISLVWQLHHISLYWQRCVNKTKIDKNVKNRGTAVNTVPQSKSPQKQNKKYLTTKHISHLTTTFIAYLFLYFIEVCQIKGIKDREILSTGIE